MYLEENKKIRNNAVSAYLLFLISILFLFKRKNSDLNNDFVRKHSKSAFLIHLLIIINILLFNFYKILGNFFILTFSLNFIISTFIFIILFGVLVLGMYKAYNGKYFTIGEIFKTDKDKNLLDINKDGNFEEKDKLTFILGYIPFLGQIFTLKYSKNLYIREILKLNIFITFIICIFFINFYTNLSQLLLLFYFIFIAFVGVNLFGKSEIIVLNLPKYFSFSEIWENFKVLVIYLKKYISGNFVEYKFLLEIEEKKMQEKDLKDYEETKKLNDLKGPKKIIYLPIINFIFLFFKENKYKIHIRNGLVISFLTILLILLILFKIFSIKILILLLFPICFGIGNLGKIYYKIPLIYDLYEFFRIFINFTIKTKKIISKKRKEVKEETIKVSDLKKENNTKKSEEQNISKNLEKEVIIEEVSKEEEK